MRSGYENARRRRSLAVLVLVCIGLIAAATSSPAATPAPIDLGRANSFAVLAGSTVTNTGPTVVNGISV